MQRNSILFLTYWYPNKSNENFAIFIKRHAHAISLKNNIKVIAFSIIYSNNLFKKSIIKFTDENGIEIHQIYIETCFNKIFYMLLPIHYFIIKPYIISTILTNYKFNLIHSNVTFPSAIIGYWLSNKFKIKHVVTEHWSKLDKFFKVSLYKNIGKKALNNAFKITVVSSFLKDNLTQHIAHKNIVIIPNVIDSSQFKVEGGILKNEQLTFIAVAHWEEPKNPFYFLEALNQLKKTNQLNDFKVVLVGDGKQIKKIKKNNYLFKLDYLGNLNASELNIQLNKSHVFLHGSDYETFSIVIVEALMCGLPCIVSPIGISKDVINTENGFITNNSITDWEDKIIKCINTKYNNTLISHQLKNKFDLDTIGNLFNNVYEL